MKKLALLFVLLMIGATIPAATVAAAVAKPVAHQAPALPVQKPPYRNPTYTTLGGKLTNPPVTWTISGTVKFRYAGKVYSVPNSPVYIISRYYNYQTKSSGPWKLRITCKTDSNGFFEHDVMPKLFTQFQAEFRGTNTLMGSTSNVITI